MASDYAFYLQLFALAIAFLAGFFIGRLSMAVQVASLRSAAKPGK